MAFDVEVLGAIGRIGCVCAYSRGRKNRRPDFGCPLAFKMWASRWRHGVSFLAMQGYVPTEAAEFW